jgi:hypothetical protein
MPPAPGSSPSQAGAAIAAPRPTTPSAPRSRLDRSPASRPPSLPSTVYPTGATSLSAKCEPKSSPANTPSVAHCPLEPATAASPSRRPSPSSRRLPRRSRPTALPPAPFSVTPAYLVPERPDTPFPLLQAEHAAPAPLPRRRVDGAASFLNAAGAAPLLLTWFVAKQ